MKKEVIISIQNLHKQFGDLLVLKGVNFDIHKGEVVSIIGSSGSGKSTLLRCINTLETFEQGDREGERDVAARHIDDDHFEQTKHF